MNKEHYNNDFILHLGLFSKEIQILSRLFFTGGMRGLLVRIGMSCLLRF
jgi:hypothetical protein